MLENYFWKLADNLNSYYKQDIDFLEIYVIFEKDLGIVNNERITYINEKATTIYIEYLSKENKI